MNKKSFSEAEVESMAPRDYRQIVREGLWTERNDSACRGYAKANLAIVPKDVAFYFFLFSHRNPRPCPVIEVTEPGSPYSTLVAPGADLRTDLPRYSVFKYGELVDEPTDIMDYWRDDLVAFLLGCSLTFDWCLDAANVRYRLIGAYLAGNIECSPAGPFKGHLVVTCRLCKSSHDAVRAIQISSRYPATHGAPIHIGDPVAIGIKDLYQPEFGGVLPISPQEPDEIALYWGCGATTQAVAMESKLPLMITHCPCHMFVTDRLSQELAVT